MPVNRIQKEYWLVIGTGILSGLIVFGGEIFKQIGFSLMELSVLAFFPSLLFLLPFLRGKRKQIFNWKNIRLLLLWASIASFVGVFQFSAIMAGAPVAIVVLLLYTQPIWTVIISRVFYKEKITNKDMLALVPAILGMAILVNPWNIQSVGSITGALLALCGGLALSGWITVGNYVGKSKIDPYVSKFMETVLEIVFIPIILIIASRIIKRPQILEFRLDWPVLVWAALIIFSFLTQVIGHILYLKGSKVVPAKEASIIMLLEPVSGALLAAFFLNQPITLAIFTGAILILSANYFILTNSTSVNSNCSNSLIKEKS